MVFGIDDSASEVFRLAFQLKRGAATRAIEIAAASVIWEDVQRIRGAGRAKQFLGGPSFGGDPGTLRRAFIVGEEIGWDLEVHRRIRSRLLRQINLRLRFDYEEDFEIAAGAGAETGPGIVHRICGDGKYDFAADRSYEMEVEFRVNDPS